MAISAEFLEFLKEQMAGFGPISARRMFGGAGLYCDGLMFALVVDDQLYLKADGASRTGFEAEGLEAFSYETSGGRNTIMSFMRAPERCLDDTEEMAAWCRLAYDAALRANAEKPKKKARARS